MSGQFQLQREPKADRLSLWVFSSIILIAFGVFLITSLNFQKDNRSKNSFNRNIFQRKRILEQEVNMEIKNTILYCKELIMLHKYKRALELLIESEKTFYKFENVKLIKKEKILLKQKLKHLIDYEFKKMEFLLKYKDKEEAFLRLKKFLNIVHDKQTIMTKYKKLLKKVEKNE